MILQFWGAAQTVTGSMHLVEANGHRLLLDCGMAQGRRQEANKLNSEFPFDVKGIDAVVLSHAHLDHSGKLPLLVKNGFSGSIFSTSATRDLCSAMLADSASLQEMDAKYVNRQNEKQGLPFIKPLYTMHDVANAMRLFQTVEFKRPLEILPGIRMTFRNAGHILGSASVALEIAEGRGSEKKVTTIAFTGDLGRKGAAVVQDPETIERADVLITESTYGGRSHGPMNEARKNLARVVSQTANNGGLLIIPAFAVGRTQDVVYHLHELMESKEIPSMPVYVDSPLATNITEIFRQHPECFDEETEQLLMQDGGRDPFGFYMLKYTHSTEESKKLNDIRRPAIIISASGMCEGGRVLHHLRRNIGDPKTTVLFVGFQAENTLGRKLLRGDKTARIYGEEYQVRARMEAIDGYSAHADEGELLDFIAAIPNKPQHVFVVHGEPDATAAMAAGLARLGIENVTIPERGERFEV
ncbi:MAG: MBL fold metallo-hydrolase [Methanothrix sp.]|nr:MBL fold metallo-hydrolase [Methanothrix sp.]OYV11905.1 MAG: metallo-beta-lactamase family protein [Methanosaeta sp. ASM2]